MFGKSGFGQQPATPSFSSFNTAQPTLNSSPFAQSAFGQPQNTFGQSSFGQPQQQQQATPFGAPQNAPGSSLFGAKPAGTQQTGFGGFGQPQQQASVFGATNTTSSLFGAQSGASAFGPKPSFGFGTTAQQQPATSLFGQTMPQQQSTSLFGQSGNTAGAGLQFGAPPTPAFGAPTGVATGTAIAKFQAQQETDTMLKSGQNTFVQTKQQCISFMKEYQEKSLEELRLEDYMANRKGPQAGSSAGGLFAAQQPAGVFGQTTTANTSLFGQSSAVQPSTGLFGPTANTMGTSSAFGQTAGGGLFGKPLTTPATTSSGFGGFGTTTSTFGTAKPFGTVTGTQSTGLFGQPQSQAPAFGQAAANTFGTAGFGQAQPAQTSLFGQPASTVAPTFGLGGAPAQTFGGFGTSTTNTSAAGGIFGAPKPAFGTGTTFGPQPAASTGFGGFGTTTGSSIFNTQKPAGFGGFGAPTQQQTAAPALGGFGTTGGTSLFGNTSGGLFGNTNTGLGTTAGGLFGGNAGFGNTSTNMSFGNTMASSFGGMQQNQQRPVETQIHQQILSLTSNPYGDNDLFKGLKPSASEDSLRPTNPAAQKALLESSSNFKVSPNIGSKIRVKPIGAVVSKKSLFDGLEEYDASLDESFSLKTNAKRLIIKPRASVGTPKTLNDSSILNRTRDELKITEKENDAPELFQNQIPLLQSSSDDLEGDRRVSWLRTAPSQGIRSRPKLRDDVGDTTINQLNTGNASKEPESQQKEAEGSPSNSLLNETFRSIDDIQGEADLSIFTGPSEPHPTGIILRRAGYYTIPTIDEIIEYMNEDGQCVVPNFTIGRRGYGNVFFDEEIDVAGLNLDEICHFRNKEIILYQDDDNKPPVGEGLNRKAQVTLDQIWPHDKNTHEPIKDPERLEAMGYEAKLRRICEKRGTKFLEYRPETGSCVFKVDHFSKYTLSDSDDEESAPTDPKKAKMILLPQNGKHAESIKEASVIRAPTDAIMRLKQQESSFYLGQHAGQRSFQTFYNPEDDTELTREPTSPSMILAKEMKTDSHKLQLMKASFFVDDDYDTRSIMSDATEGRESPDQMVPSALAQKATFAKRLVMPTVTKSFDAEEPLQVPSMEESEEVTSKRVDLVPSQIFKPVGPQAAPLIVRPRVMLFDICDMMLPMKDSILHQMIQQKNNTVAFFNGRKFKIGWARGNKLTMLGTQQNDSIFDGRSRNDSTKSILKIVQVKSMIQEKCEKFKKSIVDHLKIELKYEQRIPEEGSYCARLEANGGTKGLLEHHQLAQKMSKESSDEQIQFNSTVWSLMHALWGFIDDMDPQEHTMVMLRRDLLSSWIESVVTDTDKLKVNVDYLDRLVNLMMCHKVAEACELALENDDINLSLLLAQSSGGPSIRQLIQHQLASWREVEADEFIDERRLRLLMMVGGVPAMDGPKNSVLNIFEQLDWLKCLALQLWYISSPTSSITDAVVSYEQDFNRYAYEVASPSPSYVKQLEQKDLKYQDIRFHLMKLFSQRSHPLEALLHPANYTLDLMDNRLAFLVLQVLDTLGYQHLGEACRLKIYTSFAEQLETNDMWEWSVWTMLHIGNQNHREIAIQQLLYRHIRIDGETNEAYISKERFILEQLMVPEKWIHWAKAVRAGAIGNYHVEVKYLLKAHQWSKAHDVMMQFIAPDLVINDQIDYLKSLLEQFQNTNEIQNWKIQGQILKHFIELNERFESLNQNIHDTDIDLFLEQIKPRLSDLCSVIKLFPCPTSKHRLCQCEIAKQLVFIIRNFYANSAAYGNQACALMRVALDRLPLPQEFAQQELRHVLVSFLKEKLTIDEN